MKVSLIATVKNEAENIDKFFESILNQEVPPDEIIVTEAGSFDETYNKLISWTKKIPSLIIIQIGNKNRSIGRNIAIRKASNKIIAMSDFGCILSPQWLREITKSFEDPGIEIVSGFYIYERIDILSEAISFFTHPSIKEIDALNFIPSARSMAIRKYCLEGVGGFPEQFSNNEDTIFGYRLRNKGYKFCFNPAAQVIWNPENNIFQFIKKLFNYSKGDGESTIGSDIYQKKIFLYFTFIILTSLFVLNNYFVVLFILFTLYFIVKTFRFAYNKIQQVYPALLAVLLKPLMDITSILGYIYGRLKVLFN
jgi:glycosyltransferase involved in cell wall biosynthesis